MHPARLAQVSHVGFLVFCYKLNETIQETESPNTTVYPSIDCFPPSQVDNGAVEAGTLRHRTRGVPSLILLSDAGVHGAAGAVCKNIIDRTHTHDTEHD